MNTLQSNQTKNIVFRYLLQLGAMVIFYFVLVDITGRSLDFIIKRASTIFYVPNPGFFNMIRILLVIYAAFSYIANNFLLDLFHRTKLKQLAYSLIADILIIPLQIWIMIIFNNHFNGHKIGDLSTIYNAALVTILFIIKSLIAFKLLAAKNTRATVKTRRK